MMREKDFTKKADLCQERCVSVLGSSHYAINDNLVALHHPVVNGCSKITVLGKSQDGTAYRSLRTAARSPHMRHLRVAGLSVRALLR